MTYKRECICCGLTFTADKKSRKFCSATCFGKHRSKLYDQGLKGAEHNANSQS